MSRGPEPDRNERAWLLQFVAFALASLVVAGAGLATLAESEMLASPMLGHWTSVRFDRRIEQHEKRRDRTRASRVAVLGDSTVASYRHDERVPDYVRMQLNRRDATEPRLAPAKRDDLVQVLDLSYIGAGTVTEYFWADRIAASDPDLVIWEVGLLHFSDWWRDSSLRPGLAGWMAFERWPDLVRLPLDELGVRLDDFLLSQLLVRAGWLEAAGWLAQRQQNVRGGRIALEDVLAARAALSAEKRFRAQSRIRRVALHHDADGRLNLLGERHFLAPALDGLDSEHPVLEILAAALAYYDAHDIAVLVYLTPIDVDHLASVGAIEGDGLSLSVGRIRAVVESQGATFLDLHDLLPGHAFADLPHHYTSPPDFNALMPLSARVAEAARRLLDERGTTAGSER